MDIAEFRLQRLEAEYQAVIDAGNRGDQNSYQPVVDDGSDDDVSNSGDAQVSTPELHVEDSSSPAPTSLPRADPPLSGDQILSIKAHMQSISLKHTPSWAHAISDEALLRMCRKLAE